MYCSECGNEAAGKFCCHCGAALQDVDGGQPRDFEWRESCDYERIVQVAEVRRRVEAARAGAGKKVSSSQLLGLIDSAAAPLMGGLSSVALARIAQPLSARVGLKTGKERREFVNTHPGVVLANLAVALVTIEHTLTRVTPAPDACTLEATLPADLRSMDAALVVTVERAEHGAWISATASVAGAWYDWGKCQSGLDQLFRGLRAA